MSTPFDQLDEAHRRAHLATVAARAAPLWGVSPAARITLLNISENATYRIDDEARAEPLILRVHRTGYHSIDAIRTELAWMKALKDEAGVETPQAIAACDGQLIQTIACDKVTAITDGIELGSISMLSFAVGTHAS